MTDIIEKVAEAIENEDLRIQAEGGGKALATAALEALAEGLVWKTDTRNGDWYLRIPDNGIVRDVASVHGAEPHYSAFILGRIIEREDGKHFFASTEKAKISAMNQARRTLFGLGPVGEENG